MPVRPMLLHRMALVSFRLFCKNLGNLQEFYGQMWTNGIPSPPLPAENCPYAYGRRQFLGVLGGEGKILSGT